MIVQSISMIIQWEFNIWNIDIVQQIDRNDDTIQLRILVEPGI